MQAIDRPHYIHLMTLMLRLFKYSNPYVSKISRKRSLPPHLQVDAVSWAL
jgi:hypothetical protein